MFLIWIFMSAAAVSATPQPGLEPTGALIDHIGLSVANPAASADFYQRVLGLEPIPQKASTMMRWLRTANFQLHLIGGRTKPVDAETDTHFAFRVPSLTDELAVLDRNHVPWRNSDGAPRKITTRFDGVLQAYFQDPDGYWIEVNQAPK